jgi:hypothetical protein
MPRSTVCEVLTGKGWKPITVEDYLTLQESGGRCPECKQPIRAHRLSVNGMDAHFEHRESSPSCSLADHRR